MQQYNYMNTDCGFLGFNSMMKSDYININKWYSNAIMRGSPRKNV